jgi:shikimate dehydrogenase
MSQVLDWPAGDAVVCMSVSARPGRFGSTVHTAGYRALGLHYVYLARAAKEIAPVIAAVRTLGIRGCSVSMPFKTEVLAHLDALDPLAVEVGAVNTVVNDEGRLTGYNTDVIGVVESLQPVAKQIASALVLGAGGMSRSVLVALAQLGIRDVTIAARRRDAAAALGRDHAIQVIDWQERTGTNADLLINATSAGMSPAIDETPMPEAALHHFRVVADVVASPAETLLLAFAARRGLTTVSGLHVAFHQALAQFRHYTRCDPPVAAMRAAAEQLAGGRLTVF